MASDVYIYVGQHAVEHLTEYSAAFAEQRFTLISDTNTRAALGVQIEHAFQAAGLSFTSIVLEGEEIIADEKYLMQALIQSPPGDQIFVAIGSGTITDITRYISFRTRNPFIATPTAASVDGFISNVAPLVIKGVKDTYTAQGPIAIFADLATMAAAPGQLSAAGFGDVLGKVTALADWQLGKLLWNEPYNAVIEQRVRHALVTCFEAADEIARRSEQGIQYLMDALLETGLCISDMGNSRPASGAEHHCSHYWEMQLLKENKPAILHGSKVGYATSLITKLYDQVRALTQDDVRRLVQDASYAGYESEVEQIKYGYGPSADQIIKVQRPFLDLTEAEYTQLQQRIVDNWSTIQAIAQTVLPSSTIVELLEQVGAPTDWHSLGLEEHMVEPALLYGHYLRNRFTVVKLCKFLGLNLRQLVRGDPA
ncbi:MAG TPA: sn-glycerol-1-phosphate dehydrogenase [Aggregatilineaceae bacterium]|nr:sn-glycerol-1-phosphate dehydrogenase [Aggregatilineaceae bacterium]